jgi:5-methylcytosine-specific restriction endonuclease McrA
VSKLPKKKLSQSEFVKAYFMARPGIEISHKQSKEDLEEAWLQATGKRFEDSDRAIRRLHGIGFLQKRGKGVYLYDPDAASEVTFDEFTEEEKRQIFERDGYRCVTCGLGREHGLELHIDHIKPRSLGGQGTVENGQTLCSRHNFIKKNFSQTETGKKGFIRLLELVKSQEQNSESIALQEFLVEVLEIYEKHGINGHIRWENNK